MPVSTIKLDFITDEELTEEQVCQLHIYVYWQMVLNRSNTPEFLNKAKIRQLKGDGMPAVLFDSIGKAYEATPEEIKKIRDRGDFDAV